MKGNVINDWLHRSQLNQHTENLTSLNHCHVVCQQNLRLSATGKDLEEHCVVG